MYGSFLRNIDERVVFWCLYAMHIQKYRSTGHHLNVATNFFSQFPLRNRIEFSARKPFAKRLAIKDGLTNALIKSRIASLVLFFTDVKHVVVLLPNQYRQPSEAGSCHHLGDVISLTAKVPCHVISGYTTDKEILLFMDVTRLEKSSRFVKRAVAQWSLTS